MENYLIHDAIRNLYSNVVTIRDVDCFDENDNQIEVDMDAVMIEAERISNLPPAHPQQNLLDIIADLQAQINELKNK